MNLNDKRMVLLLTVEDAGTGGLRVEVTTADVGGTVTFDGPCWTSKYIPAMGWPR